MTKQHDILTVLNRTNSVSNPSAQTNTLCADNIGQVANWISYEQHAEAIRRESFDIWAIFTIQYKLGLRVSETLKINTLLVSKNYMYSLKRDKGSEKTIVDLSCVKEYIDYCKKRNYNNLLNVNRFQVYRLYKKRAIYVHFEKNKKNAVTHALRHQYITDLSTIENDTSIIAKNVGHVAESNTKKYIHLEKI